MQTLEGQIDSASTQEEALKLAISAAELCMKALKIATNAREKSDLSARCQKLLDQAETIKQDQKWKFSPHAIPFNPKESGSEPKKATSRIEIKKPPAPNDQATTTSKLDRKPVKGLSEPRSTRQQSKAEQILVLKASQLNGFKFPPWTDAPRAEQFQFATGKDFFW